MGQFMGIWQTIVYGDLAHHSYGDLAHHSLWGFGTP